MGEANDDGTQLICSSEPRCLCADEEYSCDCTPGGFDDRQCTGCEASLVRINVNTGDEVPR